MDDEAKVLARQMADLVEGYECGFLEKSAARLIAEALAAAREAGAQEALDGAEYAHSVEEAIQRAEQRGREAGAAEMRERAAKAVSPYKTDAQNRRAIRALPIATEDKDGRGSPSPKAGR